MTSQDRPEQLVREYYRLVDAQDFDGLVEMFAEKAIYRRPGYEPLVGRTDLAGFYGGDRVIVKGRHSITELIVHGNKVAVNGDFVGTLKDGLHAELRFADFFTVGPDGLFSSRETFFFAPMV